MNLLTQQAIVFSKQAVDQSVAEINSFFESCEKTCHLIASEIFIQEKLRGENPTDLKQRYSEELEINNRLNLISSYIINDVYGIYVIGENGAQYKSNSYKFISNDLNQSDFYKKTIQTGENTWFRAINGSKIATSIIDYNFLTVAVPITDKASGQYLGVVSVDILESTLIKRISSNSLKDKVYLFYLDENNHQVVSNAFNAEYVPDLSEGRIINKGNTKYFVLDNQKFIVVSNDTLSKWKVVALISINEIQNESISLTFIIILMTILISLLVIYLSVKTSISFSRPINELTESMKQISRGNWNVKSTIHSENEFGVMARGFNDMVDKLNLQRKRIIREQAELRKAHLDVLQSQINPHFLYNTLDLIIWMARNKQKKEIISIVYALTKLLRIALSKGEDIISLEDEVLHVKSYLTIQTIRYKGIIDYKIDIPEHYSQYRVPKLTLQPIVENAIYHGLKETQDGGTIKISIKEDKKFIELLVVDNGKGISEKMLKKINNMLVNPNKKFGFGLRNVDERIKLYFGKEYGIRVESTVKTKTTVIIKIPKIKE